MSYEFAEKMENEVLYRLHDEDEINEKFENKYDWWFC